jgi:hypothetical protein
MREDGQRDRHDESILRMRLKTQTQEILTDLGTDARILLKFMLQC